MSISVHPARHEGEGPACCSTPRVSIPPRRAGGSASRTAKVLRPADGETTVTDGPFTETRELIGSFFIVEADDLEEAVEIASLHPAARLGEEIGFAVEVWPIDRMTEKGM